MELTLCKRCADVYYEMPDKTIDRTDNLQTVKEPCDICTRLGHTYTITNKGGHYGKRETIR